MSENDSRINKKLIHSFPEEEICKRAYKIWECRNQKNDAKDDWNTAIKCLELETLINQPHKAQLSRFERLTLLMQILGFIGAIFTIFYLGEQLKEQSVATKTQTLAIESSTYQGILDKQLELDKIFIDHPELRSYIFDKKEINTNDNYYNKVVSVTEYQLDFFQMVWSQKYFIPVLKNPTSEAWQEWEKYFKSTIENNSVLCDRLKGERDFYDRAFVDFALKSCPANSTTKPQK